MQAEAGEGLETIVARKDLERRAGDGTFFWGIGNSPSAAISQLARAAVPVKVVFSIMKSPPKSIDSAPSRTVAWRRYVDVRGSERPLPVHVLVTSRGDATGGAKRFHCALMCRSDAPLTLRRGVPFDPTGFRNAGGTGAPVGASQVTALLRRTGPGDGCPDYEENVTAWLAGSYWVRLVDPVELDEPRLASLRDLTVNARDWRAAVSDIRGGDGGDRWSVPDGMLF